MSSEFLSSRVSYDPVTGVPSLSDLLPEIAALARASQETQLVYVQLDGLQEVGLAYGDHVAGLLFRQLARRLRSLLGSNELMGRYAASGLLVISARMSTGLQEFVRSIRRQVKAGALHARGRLLPEARIVVANVPQVVDERDAHSAIQTALAAAEQALLHANVDDAVPSPRAAEPRSVATPARAPGDPLIVIRRIGVAMEGIHARAMITLALRSKEVEAEVSGKNTPEQRLALVGKVTAMAITSLLPDEHTVALVSVVEDSKENVRFVRAVVELGVPGGLQHHLSAAVPVQGTTYSTAAVAVLRAVDRRVRDILKVESVSG